MAKRSNRSGARVRADTRARILDAALAQADRVGWGNVYLADVARTVRVPLPEVLRHFRDLDAVANAHFARALAAMLAESAGVHARPAPARVETLLGAWFAHLRPHAKTSAAMLMGKLYPFHPHHWVPLVFSLSRLIQWLRDAAHLRAGPPRRNGEEIFLSALFVLALLAWRGEGEAGERRARALVARAFQILSMIL
jgi:AcrR family transcriptional regulator